MQEAIYSLQLLIRILGTVCDVFVHFRTKGLYLQKARKVVLYSDCFYMFFAYKEFVYNEIHIRYDKGNNLTKYGSETFKAKRTITNWHLKNKLMSCIRDARNLQQLFRGEKM